MSEGNTPSKDPADELTLAGVMRSVHRKMMQSTDSMLPARVVAYDRAANVATVQPMVAVLTTDGSIVQRATIARVPVVAYGGGGFVVNFPLKPGDLGWIEANDRDVSLFLQSMKEAQPNTVRMHSFEDSRFLPDKIADFDVSEVGANAMTIQSVDGSVRVELTPDTIKLTAPHVTVDADDVTVNGLTTFNDLVTFNDDTITNGRRFTSHTHTGVQTGSGTSGPPT